MTTTHNEARNSPGCLILLLVLTSLAAWAQPAHEHTRDCIQSKVRNGRLLWYDCRYGWDDPSYNFSPPPGRAGVAVERFTFAEDSIPTGYLEGVYRSTAGGVRLGLVHVGARYVAFDLSSGVVLGRLEDVGLHVYPTEHEWAERWDRFLRIGKMEYFKVR